MAQLYRTKKGVDAKGRPVYHPRWRFKFTDHTGRRVARTGFTSKRETEALAFRLECEAKEIRAGLRPLPKSSVKAACRAVVDVLAEYQAWGDAAGGRGGRPWSKTHSRNLKSRLAWMVEAIGAETMADLDGCLARVEAALRCYDATHTGKTSSDIGAAFKTFCGWCAKRGILETNPLEALGSFDKTPQEIRRALTLEEIKAILDASEPHRRILYMVALATGLRAGEIRHLETCHLDLDRGGLFLAPEWTKSRRPGFQFVHPTILAEIKAYADSGDAVGRYRYATRRKDCTLEPPATPLVFVPQKTAQILDEDMARAGVSKRTPEGKADFHALRTCFVNLILATGCDVRTAMSAARHSSASMTMSVYGRTRPDAVKDAAYSVGEMLLHPQESEAKRQIYRTWERGIA